MTSKKQTSTFRFKFTEPTLNLLKEFSIIHQYDKPKVFKEAFEEFVENNNDIIGKEKFILFKNGYNGML